MRPLDPSRCIAKVFHGRIGSSQCWNKPKTANGYCAVHDPKYVAKKTKERVAKFDERSRQRSIGWKIDAARTGAWSALTVDSTDAQIVAVVRAALAEIAALEEEIDLGAGGR